MSPSTLPIVLHTAPRPEGCGACSAPPGPCGATIGPPAAPDERLALVRRNRAEPRGRRTDHAALHHRRRAVAESPVKGKYDQTVDSESAYELLQKRLHLPSRKETSAS